MKNVIKQRFLTAGSICWTVHRRAAKCKISFSSKSKLQVKLFSATSYKSTEIKVEEHRLKP